MCKECEIEDCVVFSDIANERRGTLEPPTGYVCLCDSTKPFRMDMIDREIFSGVIIAPKCDIDKSLLSPGAWVKTNDQVVIVYTGLTQQDYRDFEAETLLSRTYAQMDQVLAAYREKASCLRKSLVSTPVIHEQVIDDIIRYKPPRNDYVRRSQCVEVGQLTIAWINEQTVGLTKDESVKPEWFNSRPFRHVPADVCQEWKDLETSVEIKEEERRIAFGHQ